MLVFEERGIPEYPGKVSWSREENQQTQPTYDAVWEWNPGHAAFSGGWTPIVLTKPLNSHDFKMVIKSQRSVVIVSKFAF